MSDFAEIKDLVEKGNSAWEAYKAANDERIAEIERHGKAFPETEAKVGRIDAEVAKLAKAAEAAYKAAEAATAEAKAAREQAEAAETALRRSPRAGAAETEHEAKERKTAATWLSLASGSLILPDDPQLDVEAFRAYAPAFVGWLRKGNALRAESQKALAVGSDPDGGYWVTPVISDRVLMRVFETSPVRSIASVITIGTDAIEYPKDVDEAASGGWVGETQARPETATPQIGMHRIPTHEQYANPRITQKLLDDASFDVEGWLSRKIADILARTENTAFVNGNGIAKPRGFLDYASTAVTTGDASRAWGVLQYVASGASGAFASTAPGDALISLVHTLKPVYRGAAQWAMNRASVAAARKLKDGDGNYLWSMGDIRSGQPSTLLGFGLAELEDMPDLAADSFSVAFGDFRTGYQIVDRVGIRVLRDPFTAKPFIQFYTTKRVGADVIHFDAIKLMKFAA